jgi:preprotein translocase subunit SecE
MEALMIGKSWFWTAVVYGFGALALGMILAFREPLRRFFGEVKVELSKCTWPVDPDQKGFRRYKVLFDSTVVVCVCTILLGGYITGFDYLIGKLIGLLVSF